MDIADWLQQIGLAQYAGRFAEQDISIDILPHLTAEDLNALGVTVVGHRRRLLAAIDALRSAVEPDARSRSGAMVFRTDTGSSVERRQISVLFCDIVDSTPLSTRLDPEELRELLSKYQSDVSVAVDATGGYVAQVIWDGLQICFGWPNADETHAESAVRAAIAIIDRIRAHRLSVRIGIASGLVVIGDVVGAGAVPEQMPVGETMHLAARLEERAQPGTILVSDVTHAQVSLLFEMADIGRVQLKGFSTPQQVWRVEGQTTLSGRSEALFAVRPGPIVGRADELEFL